MTKKREYFRYFLVCILSVAFLFTVAQAATTIGDNVSTDGSITTNGTATSTISGGLIVGDDLSIASSTGDNDYASLYVDVSNNWIGIATTSPQAKLAIEGGGNFLMTMSNPVYVTSYVDSASTTAELSGAAGIDIIGNYAYIAGDLDDGVSVLDVSDPESPDLVGVIDDDATTALYGAELIKVVGNYAYVVGMYDNGLEILDISDPTNPTHVGKITDSAATLLDWPSGLYVSGNYAYITSYNESGLEIIDISNPYNPTHAGSITDAGATELSGAWGVYVQGKYAYVAGYYDDGLEIIDISDPTNPTHVGSIADDATTELNGPWNVYVSGKYAYVTAYDDNGLEILDVSDPTNPKHVGAVDDDATTELDQAFGIQVLGKYAYVTGILDDGVSIFDVSNPASPKHVGSITDDTTTDLDYAYFIFTSGKYAYVSASDAESALAILDLPGIDAPTASIGDVEVSILHTTENAQIGNDLYVNNGIVVGPGGILTDGDTSFRDLNVLATSTLSNNRVEVSSSTSSVDPVIKYDFVTINASTTSGLLQFANEPLNTGDDQGTLIGANPTAFLGDFINLQVAGDTKFKVTADGNASTTGELEIQGTIYATTSSSTALYIGGDDGDPHLQINTADTTTSTATFGNTNKYTCFTIYGDAGTVIYGRYDEDGAAMTWSATSCQ